MFFSTSHIPSNVDAIPIMRRSRAKYACNYCSEMHLKCENDIDAYGQPGPCARCTKKQFQCQYRHQLRPAFRDDTALFFRNGNELPVGNPHFQAVADFSSSSGDRYGSITTPQSVGIWAIGHNQTQGEDSALSGANAWLGTRIHTAAHAQLSDLHDLAFRRSSSAADGDIGGDHPQINQSYESNEVVSMAPPECWCVATYRCKWHIAEDERKSYVTLQ